MATITNYVTLTQAILDFTHRPALSAYTDYFIQSAEDAIYRGILDANEGRGIRWMENPLSYTINATTGAGVLPTDWLGPKYSTVVTTSGTYAMIHKDAQWIYDNYPIRSPSGIPAYVAREGTTFIYGPFPDSAYSVTGIYYQRAPALSSTNTTTWMTANIPLTFHAACMFAASQFLKDMEGGQAWMAVFNDRMQKMVDADKSETYASGALVIDAA